MRWARWLKDGRFCTFSWGRWHIRIRPDVGPKREQIPDGDVDGLRQPPHVREYTAIAIDESMKPAAEEHPVLEEEPHDPAGYPVRTRRRAGELAPIKNVGMTLTRLVLLVMAVMVVVVAARAFLSMRGR